MSDDNRDRQSEMDDWLALNGHGCLWQVAMLAVLLAFVIFAACGCNAQEPYTGPSSETGHKIAVVMILLSVTGLVGTTLWVRSRNRANHD